MSSLDALADRALSDVRECIGCNDCMLACPLPERDIVTIAELNEAVDAVEVDALNVQAFVSACTQCRQCVPVCPADLSRADMVLFNKLKVEDVAGDQPIMLQVGRRVEASGWTADLLARHIGGFGLLTDVPRGELRRLVQAGTLRQLRAGEVLVEEGSYQERLEIVLSGSLTQRATDVRGIQVELLTLGPGSFLGEMAVLSDRCEPYAVVAEQESQVLSLPKAAVRRSMDLSPPLKTALERLYAERAMDVHAARSAFLGTLPEQERQSLLAEAQFRSLAPGDVLVAQHQASDFLTIVQAGFLKVTRTGGNTDRVVVYLREGDDFGAMFVMTPGYTSDVTVTATTLCDVLQIPVARLRRSLTRFPDARKAIIAQATAEKQGAAQAASATPGRPEARNTTQLGLTLGAMLDQGILKGHQVLAIDQSRCTDCNNCVDACGRRHGRPRLERRGLQLDHLLFPAACRHCDDPRCLLCTVNGIVRRPDGEISIIDDNCIGCGSCAERCPYDNISMQPREVPRTPIRQRLVNLLAPTSAADDGPFSWLHRMLGLDPSPDNDRQLHGLDRVAVKCDLCADHHDQACVKACPTGAAFRFDPVTELGTDGAALIKGN